MKIQHFIVGLMLTCSLTAMAQPTPVVKAAKSIFTLTTFAKDGSILASSHGVFIGNNGEAVALWTPFKGAAKAVVIDANGNKMNVETIDGANEIYDICKFRVDGKAMGATLAAHQANKGEKVWLASYSVKKPSAKQIPVSNTEKFNNTYHYYIFSSQEDDINIGCPILNSKGEILGLLQKSVKGDEIHATDARFAYDQKISGMSVNDPVLKSTEIRTTLPDTHNDALLTIMMAQTTRDSNAYAVYL